MRGLDTRVDMAHARVMEVIDPAIGRDLLVDVMNKAKALGIAEYRSGQYRLPQLFVGDTDLAFWWEEGQDLAAELAEKSRCSGCKNRWGFPCAVHG